MASQKELDGLQADWNQGADPNLAAACADLAKLVKALDAALKNLRGVVSKATGGEVGSEDSALVEIAGLKPPKPDPLTAMARCKATSTAA